MARVSDRRFTLNTDDGREVAGQFVGRPPEAVGQFLGRRVVMFGTEILSPAGESVRLEVDGCLPTEGQVCVSPDYLPFTQAEMEELAGRLKSVMGQWPGDETDEEIAQALRELG
jgi:hypothetical protein